MALRLTRKILIVALPLSLVCPSTGCFCFSAEKLFEALCGSLQTLRPCPAAVASGASNSIYAVFLTL